MPATSTLIMETVNYQDIRLLRDAVWNAGTFLPHCTASQPDRRREKPEPSQSVLYFREAGNHTVAVNTPFREVNYCKMKVFECIPFRWICSHFMLRIACSHRYKVNNTYIQFVDDACPLFSHRHGFSSLTQNLLHNWHAKLNFTNTHKV
jgi:hypothetical protein